MKLVATLLGVAVNPVVFIVGNQQIAILVVMDSLRRQGLADFRTGFFKIQDFPKMCFQAFSGRRQAMAKIDQSIQYIFYSGVPLKFKLQSIQINFHSIDFICNFY